MSYARIRRLLRSCVAGALYYSGLLWLYSAVKLRRRVVVLMYHRVLPLDADTFSDGSIIVTPQCFSRHLRFLKRRFRILSVTQLADLMHSQGRLPSRGCVITFDDGWQDNIRHALPILAQHAVPAVVFLATDYVGGDSCFWQERLGRRMFLALAQPGSARSLVEAHTMPGVHLLPEAQQKHVIRRAISRMKGLSADEVARYESELARAMTTVHKGGAKNGDDVFMSWPDVARMAESSPLTAGAHGCSHVPLTSISEADIESELLASRKRIERAIGQTVSAMAYPNGNYSDVVVDLTRRAGYRIAFTTQRGLVSEGDDPFRLRRLNVHEGSARTIPELLCLILGLFHRWPGQV